MSDGLTAELAAFATEALPSDAARDMMRLSVLDWAACGIAGRDEPVARIVRDMALAEEGRAEASLIGSSRRLPARAAALVNGAGSHALDYDDTHFAHIGHPSVVVVPAALALAEREGVGGAAFLDAALIGAELSIRVGQWLGRAHYQTGFHQTATAGTFGATTAAGRILGLDTDRMTHALGLAATRASGLKSQFGTMGKPYNAGMAASNGVECALLAAGGMVSRTDGLECLQGFGETHAGQASESLADLGRTWRFLTISHKFHACCHGTHAAIEALQSLTPLATDGIETIRLSIHPRWLRVCNIEAPETGLEAKFSYRLCAAMAVSGIDSGAISVFSDDLARDPALVALRDRVEVLADEAVAETAADVVVRLKDGRELTASHDLDTPIPLDVRADKLMRKARALLGARADALWLALEGTPDLVALTPLLRGDAA